MDTRVGTPLSQRSGSTDLEPPARPLSPFGELVLTLPIKTVRALAAFLRPESTQPGRDGIAVPPMSREWLHQHAVDSDKHDVAGD